MLRILCYSVVNGNCLLILTAKSKSRQKERERERETGRKRCLFTTSFLANRCIFRYKSIKTCKSFINDIICIEVDSLKEFCNDYLRDKWKGLIIKTLPYNAMDESKNKLFFPNKCKLQMSLFSITSNNFSVQLKQGIFKDNWKWGA